MHFFAWLFGVTELREYYPAFTAHLAAQGTVLPSYVELEFEAYLKCGRLEHGFLRVCCDSNRKKCADEPVAAANADIVTLDELGPTCRPG